MSDSIGSLQPFSGLQRAAEVERDRTGNAVQQTANKQQARPLERAVEAIERGARAQKHEGRDELGQAVQQINDAVQVVRRDLEFSVDDETGKAVVKVLDARSDEVIRQIPAEEILAIAENLEEMRGMLFSDEA
ncbi:flagellar protein FlaG [Aquisalimonas lutea]|uniref:flagellar protein FlaG n=1 Tax=Aquisalimonas lutea TaxID=1327750 RepID=UPI0025B3650B|nr:flagellar protein FlaG [Aquisalimonas lutea]MDN3518273.1 flagellar protein FlaG [Aquisalimonas lutea]